MLAKKPCGTCEVLKIELDRVHDINRKLLDKLLKDPEVKVEEEREAPKPIGNQYVPWRVKQQMLERDDRERFAALKEAKTEYKELSELEKELNIS